jgi:signal transduction histidine kinase
MPAKQENKIVVKNTRKTTSETTEEIYRYAEIGKISCELFHDILNPVTGLTLFLENICNGSNNNLQIKNLNKLLEPTFESSKKIIDFVRIIQRNINEPNHTEKIILNNTINDAIKLVFQKAKLFGVSIIFIQKQNIILNCSQLYFYQMIVNLIFNAIDSFEKVDDDRKRKIIITLEIPKTNPSDILLKIKDNGIGFNQKIDIFKALYTTKKKGIGIGLTTVKNIVESKFNGKINYESIIGKGTEFTIKIPNR